MARAATIHVNSSCPRAPLSMAREHFQQFNSCHSKGSPRAATIHVNSGCPSPPSKGCSRFDNRVLEELPTTEQEVIGAPILETAAAPRRCKTDYNRHAEKSVRFGSVRRALMAED
ncbi:unnamed protein product [Prunus armeniaca]